MTTEEYKAFLFDLSDDLDKIAASYEAYGSFLDGLNSVSMPHDVSGFSLLLGSVTKDFRLSIDSIRNIDN